jgi:hypothetical protein
MARQTCFFWAERVCILTGMFTIGEEGHIALRRNFHEMAFNFRLIPGKIIQYPIGNHGP